MDHSLGWTWLFQDVRNSYSGFGERSGGWARRCGLALAELASETKTWLIKGYVARVAWGCFWKCFIRKQFKITLFSNYCQAFKDRAVKDFTGFGERRSSSLPPPIINHLVVPFASWSCIFVCALTSRQYLRALPAVRTRQAFGCSPWSYATGMNAWWVQIVSIRETKSIQLAAVWLPQAVGLSDPILSNSGYTCSSWINPTVFLGQWPTCPLSYHRHHSFPFIKDLSLCLPLSSTTLVLTRGFQCPGSLASPWLWCPSDLFLLHLILSLLCHSITMNSASLLHPTFKTLSLSRILIPTVQQACYPSRVLPSCHCSLLPSCPNFAP